MLWRVSLYPLIRVQVPQPPEWKATSPAPISTVTALALVTPLAVVEEGPPSRLASLAQEHPCDESEFCQSPGEISALTSQVPGPKGSVGEAEGGVITWVHHPHPSDQNATSVGCSSTVRDVPDPTTASSVGSRALKRFHAHSSALTARQMPDGMSEPTSQMPRLSNTSLPGGKGLSVGEGAVGAAAAAADAEGEFPVAIVG